MSAQTHRLQIASRIHFLLVREIGQGIDIERMLAQPRYARDVLLVCDACRGSELAALAQQYRRAAPRPGPVAAQPAARAGHAKQATEEWSNTASSFGLSRPQESVPASTEAPATEPGVADPPAARPRWFARWLGR